jgi:DNA-binding NtrC family response regulator
MGARTKVLILSAERSYRDALRWALAEVVDEVLIAATWSRVVPLVEKHRPSLVILDFDSIDRAGRGILTKLLDLRYHVKTVAIGTKRAIEDAEELGITTTFQKPVNVGALMAQVERLVDVPRGS